MSVARKFLSALLEQGDKKELVKYGDMTRLFEVEQTFGAVYKMIREYASASGQLPTRQIVEEKTGIKLGPEAAAHQFLYLEFRQHVMDRKVKLAGVRMKEALEKSPQEAFDIMQQSVRDIHAAMNTVNLSDFKNAYSEMMPVWTSKWSGAQEALPFGWPTMDKMAGGLMGGDLVSLVGRPKQGKSWMLLYVAMNIWKQATKPVIFVSTEMNKTIIQTRMASLFTHTSPDFFKDGLDANLFGKTTKKNLVDALKGLQTSDLPPLIVADTKMAGTVPQVIALCEQYEPCAVFIDGAYLLRHPQARTIYDRVAMNMEMIKGELAEQLDIPAFATFQFSREASKLKKGQKPGLEHIGYSDTIGQISSIVLGLFQEDDDSNAELMNERQVHVLAGRNGESGEFSTRWDFDSVDFSEIEPDEAVSMYGL
jgi:replicative DNA helicase